MPEFDREKFYLTPYRVGSDGFMFWCKSDVMTDSEQGLKRKKHNQITYKAYCQDRRKRGWEPFSLEYCESEES